MTKILMKKPDGVHIREIKTCLDVGDAPHASIDVANRTHGSSQKSEPRRFFHVLTGNYDFRLKNSLKTTIQKN
jgi:hypothetical protein